MIIIDKYKQNILENTSIYGIHKRGSSPNGAAKNPINTDVFGIFSFFKQIVSKNFLKTILIV